MADPGLGGMTRKQIPAQLQEELSNNLSCLNTRLLCKGGSSRSLMCSSQGRLDPIPWEGVEQGDLCVSFSNSVTPTTEIETDW